MAAIKAILILSPFFSPNLGGVESHLDDLVEQLNEHKIKSYVLTYSPLTTKSSYLPKEKRGYCQIIRYKWFGQQLFPKLEKYPLLDFLYLTPYLLIRSFLWLLWHKNKIDIIHSQGFNAAFIGNILSFVFNKKHVCSTHAIYENINGFSQKITTTVLSACDQILCLSEASLQQLNRWGIKSSKLTLYRYWINLKNFSPKISNKKIYDYLFVSRLIAKKGIKIFLNTAKKFPGKNFAIVGNGPLEYIVKKYSQNFKNITFLGAIQNKDLPEVYRKSKIFCIASQYPEGYGRVMMEAVATGLPVIGSNLGAIPEALDSSVSILFKPNTVNFLNTIKNLSQNPKLYSQLQKQCRSFALKKFSSKNFQIILNSYRKLLDTN